MPLHREEIVRAIGEVNDAVISRIMRIGPTAGELAEAQAWLANDEPLVNSGKPLPGGRVGEIVEILQTLEEPDEP